MVRVKGQTLCRGTGWWLELLQWNLGSDDDGRLLLMYKTQTFISSLIKSGTKPILSFLWYEKFPRTNRNTSSVTGRIKLVGETKYTHKINTVSLHSFFVTQMTLIKDALSWKTLKHSHDAWSCFFLPLWRDVLEYTCLLGYRGEEENWFSVEKKKWSERREKDTVSVTSKDTLKPAQWMCVNEYQIIYRSPRARRRVHAFMSNSV